MEKVKKKVKYSHGVSRTLTLAIIKNFHFVLCFCLNTMDREKGEGRRAAAHT